MLTCNLRIATASAAVVAVLAGGGAGWADSGLVAATPTTPGAPGTPGIGSPSWISEVLPAANLASTPTSAESKIQAKLAKLLAAKAALGPTVGVSVLDPVNGQELYGSSSSTPITPASTTKLLTAVAALTGYGADGRVPTTVVQPLPGQLVLVGGGDPLLQVDATSDPTQYRASLSSLAARTAAALRAANPGAAIPKVRLQYDDSLFTGPTRAATWEPGYTNASQPLVPPISALMADEGFIDGDVDAIPAAQAAQAFAAKLRAAGVRVSGAVKPTVAAPTATPLAQVFSPTMAMMVWQLLQHSDNTTAEMLGHLTGGRLAEDYSFSGGATATLKVLATLGVPTAGIVLHDASGLSRTNRIPPIALTKTLAAALTNANPQIWATISGLPVAGFSGTLTDRFTGTAALAGRGYVRAKTGTLTGVAALAGTVVTADGSTLIFAFMAPATPDHVAASTAYDRAAAALAKCGCGI